MPYVYIDTSQAANGDGSAASPYNSFTEVNLLTGDLGNSAVFLAGNSDTREQLKLTSASNFAINAYGDGDAPIIRGSDVVTASWVLDGSNGFYYLASQSANHGLFVDGQQVIDVATEAELTGVTQWFDSVNSRIYISFNPSGSQFEITTRAKCIWLAGCSNFVVHKDLVIEKGDESNLVADGGLDGGTILALESRYAGGWNNSGRDGILLVGLSGTPSVNVTVRNPNSHNNQNNAVELHYIDGIDFKGERNVSAMRDNGNGIELWQGMVNGYYHGLNVKGSTRRGTSNAHQNGFWSAGDNQSGSGNNPNNRFAYNIIENTNADAIMISDGVGQEIYNNTFYGCGQTNNGRAMRFIQEGTIAVGATVKNNIIVLTGATQYGCQIGNATDTATKSNMVMADNQFYHETDAASPRYQIDSTVYSALDATNALTNFKAALPTPDTTSDYGDPLFVDTTDFELSDGSPCINTGSNVGEKVDAKGYPIYGNPDKGAMEKKIMVDIKSGFGGQL